MESVEKFFRKLKFFFEDHAKVRSRLELLEKKFEQLEHRLEQLELRYMELAKYHVLDHSGIGPIFPEDTKDEVLNLFFKGANEVLKYGWDGKPNSIEEDK